MTNYKKAWMKLREIAADGCDEVLMATMLAVENECDEEIQIPPFLAKTMEVRNEMPLLR